MKLEYIRPIFVEFVPRELERDVLYISERFSTAAHLCACGCGEKVVTPLSPASWRLEKHVEKSVSLYPSIGNWNYACRSHYWIKRNRILWAGQMSERQIAFVQEKDLTDQAKHIDRVNKLKTVERSHTAQKNSHLPGKEDSEQSLWQRLLHHIGL